jgi:molybdopterin synthase sulfur carrier subunit
MSDTSQVTVLIPTPLRRFTGGEARINASGATVASLLDDLEIKHPGLKERICESDGQIRRFVNIFVNGENVREREGADTAVKPGDEIGIIPAMAGGSITFAA